jgi:hypothetical protein
MTQTTSNTEKPKFDPGKQCFFCGANNELEPRGYAGERTCGECGFGGYGEPDNPSMFYKSALWEVYQ